MFLSFAAVCAVLLPNSVSAPANVADPNLLVLSARFYRPGHGQITHYHLYMIRPDGRGRRPLTFGKSDDTAPEWLPDGRTIRFHRARQNRPSADGWCRLDTRTGAVSSVPPPPQHDYSQEQKIRERIQQEIGKDSMVAVWGPDRFVALTFQGKKNLPPYGEVPAETKEMRLYDAQGKLVKAMPVSLPEEIKRRFVAIDRPINHLQAITSLPGDHKRFLLGTFWHKAMINLQLLVDSKTGKMSYWSETPVLAFSPDGRWFLSNVAAGKTPRRWTTIAKRGDGRDLVEGVSDLFVSPVRHPDRQRTLITGDVSIAGASWRPLPRK